MPSHGTHHIRAPANPERSDGRDRTGVGKIIRPPDLRREQGAANRHGLLRADEVVGQKRGMRPVR